jgi:hypothetical protein
LGDLDRKMKKVNALPYSHTIFVAHDILR